jgi:hypothetical protein
MPSTTCLGSIWTIKNQSSSDLQSLCTRQSQVWNELPEGSLFKRQPMHAQLQAGAARTTTLPLLTTTYTLANTESSDF